MDLEENVEIFLLDNFDLDVKIILVDTLFNFDYVNKITCLNSSLCTIIMSEDYSGIGVEVGENNVKIVPVF